MLQPRPLGPPLHRRLPYRFPEMMMLLANSTSNSLSRRFQRSETWIAISGRLASGHDLLIRQQHHHLGNHWKRHVLADGNGDETARYAGIVAAAIGCFCLVLRARIGSCLGARPVIMSVAVPVETSTWGKVVFSSRSAVDAVSGRRKWRWRSFTRAVVGST